MSGLHHKALWAFVIVIFNLYEFISRFIANVQCIILECYHTFKNSYGNDIKFLESCKKDLTKIPKHLSVIIGLDEINPEILTKIAIYALLSDIEYISYYDAKGLLTIDQTYIPKYISTKKINNAHFLWSISDKRKKFGLLKYKNGLEKSLEVILLPNSSGKELLTDICRELHINRYEKDVQDALKDRTFLSNKIGMSLQKKIENIPDPELAIIFDNVMCTFGVLPWNTGFTEFSQIKTGSYFNVQTFAKILYTFSKCEQRFGK